ncbi:Kelch repeat-containing protein [Apiospora marii]|uniref:Kelch repeat-containing protein n=1 Tax=Apiospora marii TaxID=335849 RepID=A0ABR1R7B8_9PEZI
MVHLWRSAAIASSLLVGGAWGTDPYNAKNFIRRTGHSRRAKGYATVYDDGPYTKNRGLRWTSNRPFYQTVNDTLVIPLDQSWSNKTVPIKVIPKNDAPVFNEAALWVDEDQTAMYMWGGQAPWGNYTKEKALWGFDASSQQWSKKTPSNVDVFMNFVRSSLAARTTCRGTGFYLGGFASVWTDPSVKAGGNDFPVPGMLTYDMASGGWANQSTTSLNTYGNLVGGSLSCLPNFGKDNKGLVMLLGGEIARPDDYNPKSDGLVSLSNITFWDMATETWHSQLATGDIPSPRSRACVVAAASPNGGSYELFMYGGYDAAANRSMTDVYVLSVPGFVWFKADLATGAPRVSQACAVLGGQRGRQMVVVGGANNDLPFYNKFRDPDPWPNGINVLDLTDLQWKEQYDHAAAAYEPPAMVKDWYNAGNQDKVAWVSDDVKKLFKGENGSSNGYAPWTGSHTGSIVGGAVGGTVVVVLAILAFLLIRRRRSKKQWAAAQQQKPAATSEYTAAPSAAPAANNSVTDNYKYQPYAASSPGLYEAPSPDPGHNVVSGEAPPTELQGHYGQGTAAPQGHHQRQGSTGLPILHSSQQPGRQSHFYEMP